MKNRDTKKILLLVFLTAANLLCQFSQILFNRIDLSSANGIFMAFEFLCCIGMLTIDYNSGIIISSGCMGLSLITILISVMFANNEIGSVQPIKEIGELAKKNDVFFHTDAVQAYGHVPINVDELNIDMLSHGNSENVPAIAGLGVAAKEAYDNLESNVNHMYELRDALIKGLSEIENDLKTYLDKTIEKYPK